GSRYALIQRLDEQMECLAGRNTPGRRVGLRKIAAIGEVGHRVPDGRRAQPVRAQLRNRARTYRLPGFDVCADNRAQNLSMSMIERRVRSHRPLSPLEQHLSIKDCSTVAKMC